MGDYDNRGPIKSSPGIEDDLTIAARKAKKHLLNQALVTRMQKKQDFDRRRARRYRVNTELIEANGNPAEGSKILDLSMNGARLKLPFCPPFMSQLVLKFSLQASSKMFRVMGRVVWTKITLQRDWYEVGVQFYQNYWELDHLLRMGSR